MKKSTRFISTLCAFVMALSSYSVYPVMAEDANDTEEATATEATEAAEDEEEFFDGRFLDLDFEETAPPMYIIAGGANSKILTDKTTGNHYLEVEPNWSWYGYKFPQKLERGGKKYVMSMDFNTSASRTDVFSVMLGNSDTATNESIYHKFGLVMAAGSSMKIANVWVPDMEFKFNEWFHMDMEFSLDGDLKFTVYEMANPENKGSYDGKAAADGMYGHGIPGGLSFVDMLMFGCSGTWRFDNIKIEESTKIPFNYSAETTVHHAGNIFGKDDPIEFNVKVQNILRDSIKAKVSYVIKDYTGATVQQKLIDEFDFGGREVKKFKVALDPIEKFSCYDFDLLFEYTDPETGESTSYLTQRTMFSIASKRPKGSKPNRITAANLSYETPWEDIVEQMLDAGIGAGRVSYSWHAIERRQKGELDEYNPGVFDMTMLDDMRNAGVEIYYILSDGNPYYSKSGSDWTDGMRLISNPTEEAFAAWRKYLEWLTTDMADHQDYYEVFNESDYVNTPEFYCKLLKEVKQIVDKNDPTKPVIGLCPSGVPYAWIQQCLDIIGEDYQDYMDAISVHPYSFDTSPELTTPALSDTSAGTWARIFKDQDYINKMEWLVGQMNSHGYELTIYNTEVAVSSTPTSSSMLDQACELIQVEAITQALPYDIVNYWYSMHNTDSRGSEYTYKNKRNANYGLVGNPNDTVPYAAKPSYLAMCAYNTFLTDAEIIDQYVEHKEDIGATRAYRFKQTDGHQCIVMWTEWGSDNLTLDLGCKELKLYDMYANEIGTMKSNDGKYAFTSTFEPVFIVGDFDKMNVTLGDATITSNGARVNAVTNDRYTITLTDKLHRNLKVVAEDTPGGKVVENTGIVNGVGKLVIETSNDAIDEQPIKISVYDGDNIVYYSNHHTIIGGTALTYTYNVVKDPAGSGRDVMAVNVTNKTAGSVLDGTVTGDFSLLGGGQETRRMLGVNPGESKTVYLNLPVFRYAKCIRTTIDCNFNDSKFLINDKAVFTPSFKAAYNNTGEKGIKVFDKELPESDWFVADDIAAYYETGSDWDGMYDLSTQGTLFWDEEYLYVYVEAYDDVFMNTQSVANVWNGDGIQFGFQNPAAFDGMDGEFVKDTEFTDFAIAKLKDGVSAYIYSSHPYSTIPTGEVDKSKYEAIITTEGTKTYYKLALPWSTIINTDRMEGNQDIKFTFVANDADGNNNDIREGFLMLTPGLGDHKNGKEHATVTLVK